MTLTDPSTITDDITVTDQHSARLRVVNGTMESFVGTLSKRGRGRPRGSKTVFPEPMGELPESTEYGETADLLVFGGNHYAWRYRMDQLEAEFQARCKPLSIYTDSKAQIENMPKAPKRLATDHRVPDFYVPPQTYKEDAETGELEEIGSRPFKAVFDHCDCGGVDGISGYRHCAGHSGPHYSSKSPDDLTEEEYEALAPYRKDPPPPMPSVMEHLTALDMSYTDGEDCRSWGDELFHYYH